MSFFSNLFKCCESNATIQHESNNELLVAIRSENRSPSFAIIDTKASIQQNKKSQFSQNISDSKEKPKEKEKVDNQEIKFKNRIASKSPSFINIVLKPENKKESALNDKTPIIPKQENVFLTSFNNKIVDDDKQEWDVSSCGSIRKDLSPKRKKDKMKIDLKYATLGEFGWNNMEKNENDEKTKQAKTMVNEKRRISAFLNEQDCDIALSHKETGSKAGGKYKKFQTVQDEKRNRKSLELSDIQQTKEFIEELKQKNKIIHEIDENGDATPIFTHNKGGVVKF